MTQEKKLRIIKHLADRMYTAMQNLTTDTAPIRKAMDEYHNFIINSFDNPTTDNDIEEFAEEIVTNICHQWSTTGGLTYEDLIKAVKIGVIHQRDFMIKGAIQAEVSIDKENLPVLNTVVLPGNEFKLGDKVMVVVIKDSNE